MTIIDYTSLFHTTDYFKSLVPLFYDSIYPDYQNFNFSTTNKNTFFLKTDLSQNIFIKKIIAFIKDLKKHENESNMFNVCILDILKKIDDEFKNFSDDNINILESYSTNKNRKKNLLEQLSHHKKFIFDYIEYHINLKKENSLNLKQENNDVFVIKNNIDTLNSKYPYINSIVHNLNNVNLNEYCLNPLDLKTWLGFFACYINTCNYLNSKGLELNEENITKQMKQDFYNKKNSQYIDFINNLEIKLNKSLK